MRQDPNVIVVGETRDSETLQGVVNAADTGHLVFSTLHTKDSAGTITRCLDFVSGNDGNYVRGALADNLEYIVCQQLVPGVKGGRVLAMEIMRNTSGIKNLIRTGKLSQIPSTIQSGSTEGMVQMDSSLMTLYRAGKISATTAVSYSMDRDMMRNNFG
jgi:twitching motility protein PilT